MQLKVIGEIEKHKIRSLKTLFTCLGSICIGLQSSVIGVALLDLKILAGTDLQSISYLVVGRSLGFSIGSLIGGCLDQKINTQLVLIVALGISGLTQIAIPLTRSLIVMLIAHGINGITNGISDTTCNIFILKLWAKECPPFLQAYQSCFGIGSLVVSLIVQPFLQEVAHDDGNSTIVANGTKWRQSIDADSTFVAVEEKVKPLTSEDIQLRVPYSIIAGAAFCVSIAFLFSFIKYRETTDHPSRTQEVNVSNELSLDGSKNVQVTRVMDRKNQILVITATCCFTLIYNGLQKTVGTFIPAFGYDGPLHVPKKTGAFICSIYWITFTTFRLIAIILSSLFGPMTVLVLNLTNTIIAAILLAFSEYNISLFWTSCALLGIGLSSTWGSLVGYLESQFALNGKIVSCFSVSASLGSSAAIALIGYLMAINNSIFIWFSLSCSILTSLFFFIIFMICKYFLYSEIRKSVFTKIHPSLNISIKDDKY